MVLTNKETFMTPAQQREYLVELRKQNAELYGLTGARNRSDSKDPWSLPASQPADVPTQLTYTSTSLEKKHGPPKPPKSTQLRIPSTGSSSSLQQPDPTHETSRHNIESARPKIQPKPVAKPLPKPPGDTGTSPSDHPRLRTTGKCPPQIAQKPKDQTKENALQTRMVSLSLTNYDIPQYTDQASQDEGINRDIDTPTFKIDEARKVALPIFSFTEDVPQSPEGYAVPEIAIQDASISGIPASSVNRAADHAKRASREPEPRRSSRIRRPIPDSHQIQVDRGLRCANCYETFGRGRVITANGKRYHPSHFTCFECGIPLEHVDFYSHETKDDYGQVVGDEVYCHFDYHELFSPRCHVCTTPVIRDGIKALGHIYHAEHFFCALCSQTFTQEGSNGTEFVERDDLPWHPKCYEEKFSQAYMCRKCRQKIPAGDQVITLGTGSHFHHQCFQCALCKSSLEEGFYWSNNKEGICRACRAAEVKREL